MYYIEKIEVRCYKIQLNDNLSLFHASSSNNGFCKTTEKELSVSFISRYFNHYMWIQVGCTFVLFQTKVGCKFEMKGMDTLKSMK